MRSEIWRRSVIAIRDFWIVFTTGCLTLLEDSFDISFSFVFRVYSKHFFTRLGSGKCFRSTLEGNWMIFLLSLKCPQNSSDTAGIFFFNHCEEQRYALNLTIIDFCVNFKNYDQIMFSTLFFIS